MKLMRKRRVTVFLPVPKVTVFHSSCPVFFVFVLFRIGTEIPIEERAFESRKTTKKSLVVFFCYLECSSLLCVGGRYDSCLLP
jgi:hypothetical protein